MLRPHGSPDWLLFFTIHGTGLFRHPQHKYCCSAGGAVLIPAGIPHDYGLAAPGRAWDFYWAHFHPEPAWAGWLDWPLLASGIRVLERVEGSLRDGVAAAFERILQACRSGRPSGPVLAVNALENAILHLCETKPANTDRSDDRVRLAIDWINRNVGRCGGVGNVARQVGLSESRLCHLFREQTGGSVVSYMESVRMAAAREYLELTNRPVFEIASLLGYEDPYYFSRRFRVAHGKSPRAYRKNPEFCPGFLS